MKLRALNLSWLLVVLHKPSSIQAHQTSAELVHQFEEALWVENLAVRPNGSIVLATANSAVLKQVNPKTGEEVIVHDFSDVGNAIMSIAAVWPDAVVINTMNCNMTQLSCSAGTGITWLVDFQYHSSRDSSKPVNGAVIRQLAKGPSPQSILNGVAVLNQHILLMVDQALGGIWAVDLDHGGAKLLFTHESMKDPTSSGGGVNGIRVRQETLYFNNPSRGTFARVAIDKSSGQKAGDVIQIASGLGLDDFEIDERLGVAFLTNGPDNQLLQINLETGTHQVLVNGLPGPTTARWIRKHDDNWLYVATTGGYDEWLSGNVTLGGAIYKVKTSQTRA